MCSPHDLGHVILLGHTHPEPVVHLAALWAGLTLVRPSHRHSSALLSQTPDSAEPVGGAKSRLDDFEQDLLAIYSTAGLKVLPTL